MGRIQNRLIKASFVGYNPATKVVETKPVAEYAYDTAGHLRAEWDPRLEHPLKTVYGYDAYGHLTAVTAPGQESVAFTYGASAGDANTGRLLKMTQAPASAALWAGQPPKATENPELLGGAGVGVRMGVANGTWSNSPVTYAYQWSDCNASGEGCTPIIGATNANYTPSTKDVGDTVMAEVTATNGGGSVTARSAASSVVVATGSSSQDIDGTASLGAVSCTPGTSDCAVGDASGKALYATNVSATAAASWNTWSGPGTSPAQAIACPATSLCTLADGGSVYWASSLGGSWTLAFSPSYPVVALTCPTSSFCVDGQAEDGGYIRYSTNPASTSWTAEDIAGSTNVNGVLVPLRIVLCRR